MAVRSIGIIGNGVVGGALWYAFEDYDVRVYDIVAARRNTELEETLKADLIFICLPTPMKSNYACDISAIEGFFYLLKAHLDLPVDFKKCRYVLRSTVPIGFTKMLKAKFGLRYICHSPEFLTARTAKEDAASPRLNIIGSSGVGLMAHIQDDACRDVYDLYKERYREAPTYVLSSEDSEAIKLFQNAFSAIKISAFNEFEKLARAYKLSWDDCLQGLLAQGWINPMHTEVPGPDGKYGYGGTCLPKDIANLIYCGQEKQLPMDICRAAVESNKLNRERDK